MPRPKSLHPKHCHNKVSGRGFVVLNGQWKYTGKWGTPEADAEYHRFVAEWIASGRRQVEAADAGAAPQFLVKQLLAAFLVHAKTYYRKIDGAPTSEFRNFVHAIRPLRRLFGSTPVTKFGPLKLRAVREEMIRMNWARTRINREMNRLRHVFKWGVQQEIVPPDVLVGLQAVGGLKAGRSEAKESHRVRPVPGPTVEQTLGHLSRQVRAMVRLQLLTGARSGEIVRLRTGDIDRSGSVWVYTPGDHKTAHHGHERAIYIGPKAQEVLAPFLRMDPDAYCFSPAEAEAERRARLREARRTPLGQGNAPGTNRKRKPARTPGQRYTVESYCKAIYRGCDAAFPPPDHLRPRTSLEGGRQESRTAFLRRLSDEQRAELKGWQKAHRWHPHQLRHTAGTLLRREYGIDAAKVVLGHRTLTATQVYAEKDVEAAKRIMGEVG